MPGVDLHHVAELRLELLLGHGRTRAVFAYSRSFEQGHVDAGGRRVNQALKATLAPVGAQIG